MRLKDYYRTLEVRPSATGEEIKKSFRRLALLHHPDHNADNPFAEGHFREIKEAYNILGNDKSRKKYDDERWLAGTTTHAKHTTRTTPAWLLNETARLRRHMEKIDTYRMNHPALQQYILLLLADEPMNVMHVQNDYKANARVVEDILAATKPLRLDLMEPIKERLMQLAGKEKWLQQMIETAWMERVNAAAWEKRFPLLMLMMFLFIGLLVAGIHLFS
jgi:DnaJ-domain-containing protein 1